MNNDKLFLLDAYALIYRAYYALMRSPRFTAHGINTSAIFGFCNTLDEVLRKEAPGYIAVCFDPPHGRTFRHEIFEGYKASREKQPEDITVAIPYIKRILQAMHIPVIEVPGFEADDVIGTIAHHADSTGLTTYMMTADKDYGQLVTDRVLMYRPSFRGQGFEIRGPKQICERYGIERPSQIIDLLALEGDKIDDVPGCPGIGEVTAQKIIAQFGSVENAIKHAHEIKGANGRRLAENAKQIMLSKYLVTIRTDVPINIDFDQYRITVPDVDALAAIYRELEFRTLLARLGAPAPPAPSPVAEQPAKSLDDASIFDILDEPEQPSLADAPIPSHDILSDPDAIAAFVARSAATQRLAMLLDTDSVPDDMTAALRGVALITDAGAIYAEMPQFEPLIADSLAAMAPLITGSSLTLVTDDVKRAIVVLKRYGIDLTENYYDVTLAHYLLAPEMSHDISAIAATILGERTGDYELTATERRKLRFESTVDAAAFMLQRADVCLRLMPQLQERIVADGLDTLLRQIEMPTAAVLARMEMEGMRIDTNELSALSRRLTATLSELEQQVYDLAGGPFNIGSPSQVGEVLFGRLKIDDKARRTKRGQWSTTEEVLEKYAANHPIVHLILEIRGLRKLLATYVDALPRMINPLTGKVHTTFQQTVTATGRLSSSNPNLQNIPVRTDDGREIRRAFVADPGRLMLSADYSQIELRLMADISGDPEMLAAFASGEDVHRATAAKIFRRTLDEVTPDERRAAKTANFGIIYGISAFGLAERLGISRAQARELIDGYFRTYPGVKEYIERSIAQARERGYVATIHGRRRMLPDINSRNATVRGYAERNAVNAPLQGSAADIIKIAMISIDREIRRRGLQSRMIMQVHDELIFNVVPDEADELRALVIDLMQSAYSGRVTLTVSAGLGTNWLEVH